MSSPTPPWPHGPNAPQVQPWIGQGRPRSRTADIVGGIAIAIAVVLGVFGLVVVGFIAFVLISFNNNSGSNK